MAQLAQLAYLARNAQIARSRPSNGPAAQGSSWASWRRRSRARSEIDAKLASIPLFEGVDRSTMRQLRPLHSVVDVKPGKSVFNQGEIVRQFVAIIEGCLGVFVDGCLIGTLTGGDLIGARELLNDFAGPRGAARATTTAIDPVKVLLWTPREFCGLLDASPTIQSRVRASAAAPLLPEGAPASVRRRSRTMPGFVRQPHPIW